MRFSWKNISIVKKYGSIWYQPVGHEYVCTCTLRYMQTWTRALELSHSSQQHFLSSRAESSPHTSFLTNTEVLQHTPTTSDTQPASLKSRWGNWFSQQRTRWEENRPSWTTHQLVHSKNNAVNYLDFSNIWQRVTKEGSRLKTLS